VVDLVVGYARGYEATDILPFLKTLRASGYSGRVLLLANGGAQKEAANWDVDVRPCPPPQCSLTQIGSFTWHGC